MSSKMKNRIAQIEKNLKKMGKLTLAAITEGVESFTTLDQNLADQVIKNDEKLAALEEAIESESVRAIARFQPVAADVRKLTVYLKVITDLRRIARYGYNMAVLTKRMENQQHFKRLIKIPEMGKMTVRMTQSALDALLKARAESPLKMLLDDDELVDCMMEELFRELVTYAAEDPSKFTVAMYYLLAGRYLERAEDHAVSIGYHIHYMKTGERSYNYTPEQLCKRTIT